VARLTRDAQGRSSIQLKTSPGNSRPPPLCTSTAPFRFTMEDPLDPSSVLQRNILTCFGASRVFSVQPCIASSGNQVCPENVKALRIISCRTDPRRLRSPLSPFFWVRTTSSSRFSLLPTNLMRVGDKVRRGEMYPCFQ